MDPNMLLTSPFNIYDTNVQSMFSYNINNISKYFHLDKDGYDKIPGLWGVRSIFNCYICEISLNCPSPRVTELFPQCPPPRAGDCYHSYLIHCPPDIKLALYINNHYTPSHLLSLSLTILQRSCQARQTPVRPRGAEMKLRISWAEVSSQKSHTASMIFI